jgi:hypothetical protein
MKKTVLAAAIALSSLSLAACGGGASENLAVANETVSDDLNLSAPAEEGTYGNDASFNAADLNTLGPVDDPALSNETLPADNGVANAL